MPANAESEPLVKQLVKVQRFLNGHRISTAPVPGSVTLLQEIYAMMLHLWIHTKPGNVWYDPDYPGFSERVDLLMQHLERIL